MDKDAQRQYREPLPSELSQSQSQQSSPRPPVSQQPSGMSAFFAGLRNGWTGAGLTSEEWFQGTNWLQRVRDPELRNKMKQYYENGNRTSRRVNKNMFSNIVDSIVRQNKSRRK